MELFQISTAPYAPSLRGWCSAQRIINTNDCQWQSYLYNLPSDARLGECPIEKCECFQYNYYTPSTTSWSPSLIEGGTGRRGRRPLRCSKANSSTNWNLKRSAVGGRFVNRPYGVIMYRWGFWQRKCRCREQRHVLFFFWGESAAATAAGGGSLLLRVCLLCPAAVGLGGF